MRAADLVESILEQSGLSKSRLSASSGVSRSLIDSYLSGERHPSIAQLARLAESAGLDLQASVTPRPRSVPAAFVAVLEFGELFPRREPRPLVDLSAVWRTAGAGRPGG
jgi:transcriptional regulator with XRE-family HTH domain